MCPNQRKASLAVVKSFGSLCKTVGRVAAFAGLLSELPLVRIIWFVAAFAFGGEAAELLNTASFCIRLCGVAILASNGSVQAR